MLALYVYTIQLCTIRSGTVTETNTKLQTTPVIAIYLHFGAACAKYKDAINLPGKCLFILITFL